MNRSFTLNSVYYIIITTFTILEHLDIDTGYSSFWIKK